MAESTSSLSAAAATRRACARAYGNLCGEAHRGTTSNTFITFFLNTPASSRPRVTALVYYLSTKTTARYVSSGAEAREHLLGINYNDLSDTTFFRRNLPAPLPPSGASHDSLLLDVAGAANEAPRK